jgi:preprotein translocase subunit YajC
MFISEAFAQAAPGTPGGDLISFLVPVVAMLAIFWFLLIRPQQKRVREHQELIKNVRRGDVVVTSGGLIGKVNRVVDDNEVLLEVAENVRMRLQKSAISEVRTKGEPVSSEPAEAPAGPGRRKSAAQKK